VRRAAPLLLALLVVLAACGDDPGEPTAAGAPDVARGQELFVANCAVCHGPLGEGSATGPPLVHPIYEPSHHSDEAFHLAVQRGVQPHHWDYGPMPAIPGLDRDEVADIIAYIRGLQRDAGIE
jgi:mono/diheme cytochrome c family protein